MALVDDTEDYIKSNYYDGQPINPMLSGPAALLGAVSHSVIRGQIISLGIASIILFSIMALVFRSLIGGVLASLPMLLAVTLIFGLLGNLSIQLKKPTSLLTCILVGVGIDYSVHFLWHLREHLREGDNLNDAISNTMKVSGKGILFNGISVIVGFSVLMFSVFMPLKEFSILIMASIGFFINRSGIIQVGSKVMIIGLIPNIFVASSVMGLLGLLNIPLDIMTITVAAISVGMAVDNTIHYILSLIHI